MTESIERADSGSAQTRAPEKVGVDRRNGHHLVSEGVGWTRDVRRAPPSAGVILGLQRLVGNSALTSLPLQPPRTVQRRRVPKAAHSDPLLSPGAVDRSAHRAGMETVIARALSELTSAQRTAVNAAAVGLAGGAPAWAALDPFGRTRLLADAIRSSHPDLVLGDPALIDVGARPGTADAANIASLAAAAGAAMGILISGARDSDLAEIFGPSRVATVKARYLAARTQMNLLRTAGRIVTDRSGYNAEVGLGGFTNPSQISLSPSTIDHPADRESIVTLVHESMHAGVPSIDDRGYISAPSFITLSEPDKLDNAAHYEIAVRRMWSMAHSFAGIVFVPAGTSVVVGGATRTAPALTPLEQAARRASETARGAWAMGLNMHSLWVHVNLHRGDWNTLSLPATFSGASSPHFASCLPFWSKVEGLTVHARSGISAAGVAASRAPVTQVDVALSEGLIRLLAAAMDLGDNRLDTPAHITSFLAGATTPAERSAATTVAEKTTLVLRALRRGVGPMTGSESRDIRVMRRMAAAPDFSQMLVTRSPSGFN